MAIETLPPLPVHLATHLDERADTFTRAWVERVAERLGVTPERLAPTAEFTDHVPELVHSLAGAMRMGSALLRSETTDRIRLFVQLRREQGHAPAEVLAEIEVLAQLVWESVREAMGEYRGEMDVTGAVAQMALLRETLAGVGAAAMEAYYREQAEQSRELALRLEEFGNMIVHELKNPLYNIQMGAELLGEKLAVEGRVDYERYLGWIQRGVERAKDLLDDVRMLALAEGAQACQRWVTLHTMVDTVVQQVRESANKNGVTLDVRDPLPAIEVDAVQVGVALMNLVTNAVKYCDHRKPDRRVWLAVEASAEWRGGWRFTVADNGLGIPRELQHKVFSKHFRAHPEAAEGTGLGLAITQQVVEQRHGRLGFESEEGKGSTFWFVVPERHAGGGVEREIAPGDGRPPAAREFAPAPRG